MFIADNKVVDFAEIVVLFLISSLKPHYLPHNRQYLPHP